MALVLKKTPLALPEQILMQPQNYKHLLDEPIFQKLSDTAAEAGHEAYLIGGYVRDLFLKRHGKDLDVVTAGSGVELAELVAKSFGNIPVTVFKNFGTAMLQYDGWEIEFVGARKESYSADSRKPSVETGSLKDDQNRRDFTVNAMALSLNKADFGEIIDPFNGIEDLRKKIIRTPLDPELTFSDDPLRMLRAIRFATQLKFKIEKSSLQAIKSMNPRIKIISMERIISELNKIILAPKPSIGFKLLFDTELLDHFFPEMTALYGVEEKNGKMHKDNFYHTLEVLDNVASLTDNLWLRWAAILHDIAKPATKRFSEENGWTFHGHEDKGARMVPAIFKRLKLPLDHKMKYVQKLVALHLRPIALTKEVATDSAIRRLLFDAGDDVDDLMLLSKCDITSKNEAKVKRYLTNYEKVQQKLVEVEEKDRLRNWQPPISGEVIMKTFGINPSREVGMIKNSIREAILDGEIQNNFEEAFQFMVNEGKKFGLTPRRK